MTANIARHFAAAGGVPYMNRVLQIKLSGQRSQIVSVRVHIVPFPGLLGTAVAAPVMGNDSIAPLSEKHHLCVPVVRGQRPAVAEYNGLAFSPVLVKDSCAVFRGDCRHRMFSFYF